MDLNVPENQAVFAYLLRNGPKDQLTAPNDCAVDPYHDLGSHPDVVEHVWDKLGAALGPAFRQIVYGNPALVHPVTGMVMVLSFGTQYVLRLSPEMAEQAKAAGCRTTNQWSTGETTDLEQVLGPGWVFGNWSDQELQWLIDSYPPMNEST